MILRTQTGTLQTGFEAIFSGANLNRRVLIDLYLTTIKPKFESSVEAEANLNWKKQTLQFPARMLLSKAISLLNGPFDFCLPTFVHLLLSTNKSKS